MLDLPLDDAGISADDERTVHLLILGFGRMGRSLALRAAKMGHFANGRSLRITVVDRRAREQGERFLFRHPILGPGGFCELKFHPGEVESHLTRSRVAEWAAEPGTLLHVFICLDDDARATEVGLRLQGELQSRPHCRLTVRLHSPRSLTDMFAGGAAMSAFGMVRDACVEEAFRRQHNETLACAMHERATLRQAAPGPDNPDNTTGYHGWDLLPEEDRESYRQQADHLAIKLRAIGGGCAPVSGAGKVPVPLSPSEVETLARMEHARWCAERLLGDWHYGTPSDPARRVDADLVPWNDLVESVQDERRESVRGLPALVAGPPPPGEIARNPST